jgi:hypothetical protein
MPLPKRSSTIVVKSKRKPFDDKLHTRHVEIQTHNASGLVSRTLYLKPTRLPGNPADDYEAFDTDRRVVGRIMRHPQAPEDCPWFWTITAREIPPSVHNHGYSTTREQAMMDFKRAGWPVSADLCPLFPTICCFLNLFLPTISGLGGVRC